MMTEEEPVKLLTSSKKEKSKKKKRSKEESLEQGSPHKKPKNMEIKIDNSDKTEEKSDNTHELSTETDKKLKKKKRSKDKISQSDVSGSSKKSKRVAMEKNLSNGNKNNIENEKHSSETKDKEAIREKKREKRRQKKEAKQKQKLISQGKSSDDKVEVAKTESISYLHKWKNNKKEWSFQKVRQVWLLQNMYKSEMITDEDFSMMLEYMNGMKGKAREVTVEKAEEIMKENEESDSEKEEKLGNSTEMAKKVDRARDIIQLLS